MKFTRTVPALFALALAACGESDQSDSSVTDLNRVASDGEAEAMAQALPAGDFLDLELGAKIVGPQGDEVSGRLSNAEGAFADIRSFVACPAGMNPCNPAQAPEGTIFTYVHVVYPGEDNEATTGSGAGNDASNVETAEAFRMTMPSHGFTGKAGYSKGEALAAMGPSTDIVITCPENSIAWTVEEGDGGDQWGQGEPITFYWQSTLPPAGPADAYEIFANYTSAIGPGPYPARSDVATNACGSTGPGLASTGD